MVLLFLTGFTDEKLVGASPERVKKKKTKVAVAAAQNRPPPRPMVPVPQVVQPVNIVLQAPVVGE